MTRDFIPNDGLAQALARSEQHVRDAQLSAALQVPEVARDALMAERIDDVADVCRQFKLSEPHFRAALAALKGPQE